MKLEEFEIDPEILAKFHAQNELLATYLEETSDLTDEQWELMTKRSVVYSPREVKS